MGAARVIRFRARVGRIGTLLLLLLLLLLLRLMVVVWLFALLLLLLLLALNHTRPIFVVAVAVLWL